MQTGKLSIVLVLAALSACSEPGGPEPKPEVTAKQAVPDQVPPAVAEKLPADFELTSFKWDGPMKAGEQLRVRNPYGDIRCRKSGTQELVVSAQIQTFTDWQPPPELEVIETERGYEILISHPQARRAPFDGDYEQGFAGRIDVAVLLPAGTTADLTTTDGAIRVKGFDGDLDARSGSGPLYYKASGGFMLSTGSGEVEADVSDFARDNRGEISTDSGAVSLRLDAAGTATVEAESDGKISFKADPEIRAGKKRAKGRMQVYLGGGGRYLKIHSDSGEIAITAD